MRKLSLLCTLLVCLLAACSNADYFKPEKTSALRAPSYPLVTIDPYTSIWSFNDQLNEDATRHWTGKKHPLIGALRVDGKTYRFMGMEEPPLKVILPTAANQKWEAAYTEQEPVANWTATDFNDTSWKQGKAAFGTTDMPNLSTPWESKDIWVRRTFDLAEDYSLQTLILEYSHDDIFELYINGTQVISTGYSWNNNIIYELPDEVKASLKPGKNVIAAHCHNRVGGAYVDFGLFMREKNSTYFDLPAVQKSVNVLPTQTFYTFECGPVELNLIFTAPLLMDDLDLMTRPVNYISYQVKPLDGQPHEVQVYMEATPDLAVNVPGQEVESEAFLGDADGKLVYARTGTTEQPVLQKKGDDVRIDWGYFYMAAGKKEHVNVGIGAYRQMKKLFAEKGNVSMVGLPSENGPAAEGVLCLSDDLGKVSSVADGFMMVGYDDLYAIQYFNDNRMAYWKHDGKVDMIQALDKANADYTSIMNRCRAFDTRMMNDAEKAGGKEYAELCALAYRQSLAAHKLVTDKEGNLLFFSKENFSNGSIGTVDITYPSAPLYLLYNPELLKGMMNPIFYYSESGKWKKPFAAHDVGTYPLANGQTYGGDMPVEESGNMLILTTAIALREGNADYAKKHWEVLTTWANYLLKEGLDPENQLCTDDFAGHFAHNANLSIKAIIGIAGYGKLAEMLGDKETADKYISAAKEMAQKWQTMADAGDHYRLTFDQPDTWSQKYNLVWDKLLGMGIFPQEIAGKEMAYYQTVQNKYGLPLDSRKTYTKSDWILWTACLTDNINDFYQLVSPVYKYANETTTRMPLSDWHETTNANSVGFRARSVVGGYFMKMLEQKMYKGASQAGPVAPAKAEAKTPEAKMYKNPVIDYSLPDPSIIKADDGYFYVYATEDIRNLPIHRSKNLVDWEEVGTAFTNETRPTFEPKGGLWAPDINYIGGQYVLYYSMSVWGGEWTCGIGVATSDKPEGPFKDHGPLFRSKEIDVQNSIDQYYIEDNGKKYLFWGSFRGIYGIELSGDGLSVREGATKRQVAGTAYEGTYIHKKGGFYYLFASVGSCCEGLKSTYTTVVGRSKDLFGPYVNKQGQPMMENYHEILIHGNDAFVGTGHNSEIVTDKAGNDWIFYHAVSKANPTGRVLMMDRVRWVDGWPEVAGATPSLEAEAPVF